jgi:hypothetical protein
VIVSRLSDEARSRSVALLGGQFRADQVKRFPRRLVNFARTLPDFLVIGAQKSGTTTLYDYIVQHPDVRAALTKEVHFFDDNFQRGAGWYRSNFPVGAAPLGTTNRWQTGEASPYYLLHPLAPRRAAQVLPHAKLLVTLRHPVDRAYSHYQHERAKGTEPLTFAEAIEQESARTEGPWQQLSSGAVARAPEVQSFSYLARGRYDEQLSRWLQHFAREQMYVISAERLFSEPAVVMRGVFNFLGLDAANGIDYRRLNSRQYAGLDPELRRQLEDELRGSVRTVNQLLDTDFDWGL